MTLDRNRDDQRATQLPALERAGRFRRRARRKPETLLERSHDLEPGLVALLDQEGDVRVVERPVAPELRPNLEVGRLVIVPVLGVRERVGELARDASERLVLTRFERRRGDVDGQHHVASERARHAHGQVVGDAAIDQQPAVPLDWHEEHRERHAGPHGARQVAVVEHDALAVVERRGHGAEGDRQPVEVVLRAKAGTGEMTGEEAVDAVVRERGRRQADLPVLEPEGEECWQVVEALRDRHEPPLGSPAEQALPVERGHDAFEPLAVDPRGVERADHRAHAGARDCVGPQAVVLERAQHADVGDAARPAARECQGQTRAMALRRRLARRALQGGGEQEQRADAQGAPAGRYWSARVRKAPLVRPSMRRPAAAPSPAARRPAAPSRLRPARRETAPASCGRARLRRCAPLRARGPHDFGRAVGQMRMQRAPSAGVVAHQILDRERIGAVDRERAKLLGGPMEAVDVEVRVAQGRSANCASVAAWLTASSAMLR